MANFESAHHHQVALGDELRIGAFAPPVEAGLVRVDEVARRGGGKVEVRRIAEHVQMDPDMMADLRAVGLVPGEEVVVGPSKGDGNPIEVTGPSNTAELPPTVLHAVLARAK